METKIIQLEALAEWAKADGGIEEHKKEWGTEFLLGTAIVIADIWAIVKTLQSPFTPGTKSLCVQVIFLLPGIDLDIWFFMGPRGGRV